MKLKLLHSALACFVLYAVSCTHGLEKHAFGSVLDWRPWQQRARHVCHNQLLILIPIYGHLGGFLLLRQKGLCLEAPPATSSTKSCIYMQDSLPNPLTTQRQSWCLNLALQQVHSLFWICVDFAVQDGFGFLGLAGLIKHPNGPLKIVFWAVCRCYMDQCLAELYCRGCQYCFSMFFLFTQLPSLLKARCL